MTIETTAHSLDTQVLDIPLAQLHDSPFNPRKTYDEKALQELADTMRPPHGRVLQPVVVRVLPTTLRPLLEGADTFTDYQLVFGHRRKRAAELAGLTTIPALVRSMTDEEVQRAQIVENLARADVHAIEEAEGFAALMKDHGVTADQLVADTGKSRSYIYGRLKLLQAIPEVRDACLRGDFGSETALLIARLREPRLQTKALAALKAKNISLTDGGARSYRYAKELLARMFTLSLKEAIFDTGNPTLLRDAGACTSCPKLSGNAPEFADIAVDGMKTSWGTDIKPDPQRCTDPTCWDAKHAAHLKQLADNLRAEGKTVVDGAKARQAMNAAGQVKGAYVELDARLKAALKKANKSADLAKLQVLIQDPRTGKTTAAVPRAALGMTAAASVVASQANAHSAAAAQRAAEAEERNRRRDALAALQNAVHAQLKDQPRTYFDLQAVVGAILAANPWNARHDLLDRLGYESMATLRDALPTMTGDQLGLVLVTWAMQEFDDEYTPAEELLTTRLALHYGIGLPESMAASAENPATSGTEPDSTHTTEADHDHDDADEDEAAAAQV